MSRLHVPHLAADADPMRAALAFAAAGWFVGPARSDGAKHPGSVLGKGWPTKTSRDPQVIAAWFAGTDHVPFLHVGRSGAVAFDVDHPDALPVVLADAERDAAPPTQYTRPAGGPDEHRRHVLFARPDGRHIGNGAGGLGREFGEVRGDNGIVRLVPGARWANVGVLPMIPRRLLDALPASAPGEHAADPAEVREFAAAHPGPGTAPGTERGALRTFERLAAEGSRHVALVEAACMAAREVRAGYYPAAAAVEVLRSAFIAAMAESRTGGRVLDARSARLEFDGVWSYAVGQVAHLTPDAAAGKVANRPTSAPGGAVRLGRALPSVVPGAVAPAELPAEPRVVIPLPVPEPEPYDHEAAERAAFDAEVAAVLRKRAISRAADAAERPATRAPALVSLADLLDEDDEPDTFRVGEVWPTGGKIILAAPQKAGKTTLMGNLVASLADGRPFLGRYAVEPLEGRRVVLLDFEMTRRKLRAWLGRQAVEHPEAVHVDLLRGTTWDPRDDRTRAEWADRLRELDCGVLVVDPLGPILHGLGVDENDNSAVGAVLHALDALVLEAGVGDLMVTHHMGHAGERSRGATVLRGWPDAEWRLIVDRPDNGREPDPDAPRFFAATGRDVAVPETVLTFDAASGRYALGEGNRAVAAVDRQGAAVLAVVQANPGASGKTIKAELRGSGIGTDKVGDVLAGLIRRGQVHAHALGAGLPTRHYAGPCGDGCPC